MVGFKFGSSTGKSRFSFDTFLQIKTEHVSGSVTGHIPSSSKGKTGKKTVIEDVEDDIDELPNSDFFQSHQTLTMEVNQPPIIYFIK